MEPKKRLLLCAAIILAIAVPIAVVPGLGETLLDLIRFAIYAVVLIGICEDTNFLSSECKVTPGVMILKLCALALVAALIRMGVKRWKERRKGKEVT